MKKLESRVDFIIETILREDKSLSQSELLIEMKKIGIEKLPYSYSSLKKFIDSKTMDVHYNKHYKGYVDKLNKALSKKDYGDLELESIVKSISRFNKTIRNNAGGAFNHALFWKMLSPRTQSPSGAVLEKIKKDFSSYEKFKKEFEQVAKDKFGSGWVWLVINKKNNLKIVSTTNQDNPLMNTEKDGGYPILGLDLWEHAYYLKYQNKRDEYIKNFWKVVNWKFVNDLFEMKLKTKLNENLIINNIMSEAISERCTPESVDGIRITFNINPEVKKIFRYKIDSILKDVFKTYWKEQGEYSRDSMSGIYDYETEGRSVLNKLNTNFNAFCILLRDLNKVLRREGKKTLTIVGLPPREQIIETKIFVNYLEEYKDRIFDESSATFQGILKMLGITNQIGSETEKEVEKKLKRKFGVDNVELIGELGSKMDMIQGIDCVITINGKRYTAQIKPYTSMDDSLKGFIKMTGSQSKPYSTDFMIFYQKNNITVIFKNDNTKIVNGEYLFPESDLVYILN